jgi:hypothetical protein
MSYHDVTRPKASKPGRRWLDEKFENCDANALPMQSMPQSPTECCSYLLMVVSTLEAPLMPPVDRQSFETNEKNRAQTIQ